MTTDNPDPLEAMWEALEQECKEHAALNNPAPLEVWTNARRTHDFAKRPGPDRHPNPDQAAAAIIAQHYAPVIAREARLREAASFLIDRIDELDWSLSAEDLAREHAGHVDPALERLRAALGAKP